jgi:prolyl oligopeptidase
MISFLKFFTLALLTTQSFAQYIYPVPKKITQTEVRFGTVIEDPFKWMENASDPDLWSWIEDQKTFARDYLDQNLFETYASRVLDMRKIRDEQVRNQQTMLASTLPGLEDDITLMGRPEKRLMKWEGYPTSLKSNAPKKDSSLFKIQTQTVHSGDLMRVIVSQKSDNKVVDILLVKFYNFIAWADDQNFYYISDLDERIGGGRPALFKHTVGDIQSEDQVLVTGKSATSSMMIHQIGEKFFIELDGSIGSLQLDSGKMSNRLPVNGKIVEITNENDPGAVILTFQNANFGELQKLRLRDGQRKLFLKEQNFVLDRSIHLSPSETLIIGLKDASNVVGVLSFPNSLELIQELQDGTIEYLGLKNNKVRLSIETYSSPKKFYNYDLGTKELSLVGAHSYPVEIEAEKIFYTASNGQEASMWVMKKKGTVLSSKTPLILYGYGGFRVSVTPAFGIYESLPWLERGGALAVVTLPGSLDYGESWYQLARNSGRIHSFDSFALAAKTLFNKGWTSPEHIGMMGASNGGTLVAGTLQRHSEIFKAAVPLVGVMDLINFSLFTAGKYWTNDYGNPFNEKDFKGIYPLSPYHNLQKRDYPATLVMTAEFDDRVVPMHSYKYVARLQEYNTSSAPILLYNKEWGGHARASGSARESSRFVSAFYTFFSQQLGL